MLSSSQVSKVESRMVSQLLSPVDSDFDSNCRLVGILNNLPHACKFPLSLSLTLPLFVDATRKALLGVYLIFHMPPQLLPPRRLLTDQLHHCTTTLSGYVNCLHK
ncbi:hypothetical protein ACLKA6_016593 [Drosophila palustris]